MSPINIESLSPDALSLIRLGEWYTRNDSTPVSACMTGAGLSAPIACGRLDLTWKPRTARDRATRRAVVAAHEAARAAKQAEEDRWTAAVEARAVSLELSPGRLHEIAAERWGLRWGSRYRAIGSDGVDPIGVTVAHVYYAEEGDLEGGLGRLMRFMVGALHPHVEHPPRSPAGWVWNFARAGTWGEWRRCESEEAGRLECQEAIIAEATADPEFVALVHRGLAAQELEHEENRP